MSASRPLCLRLSAILFPALLCAQVDPQPGALLAPGATAPSAFAGPSLRPHVDTRPMLLSGTAGLQMVNGELWGFSSHYKVNFHDDGFEFTPALGPAAPHNQPLTFRLESIRRGVTLLACKLGQSAHSGLRVEYDRGAAIERYDLAADGMEQSFVFATRPAGGGDLVVRGRLRTDMLVASDGGGLRLEGPGGGCRIGNVVGIDAKGQRVAGQLRYDDGILEYSLPAAFVEHAALPFVLDPPFGGTFGVATTSASEIAPDAAYDVTNDCYLVVWETAFSTSDHDIHAQRLSRSGPLLGTRIAIATSTDLEKQPSVANINQDDAFVVVFVHQTAFNNGDIVAGVVFAASGVAVVGTVVAGSPLIQDSPSVGGNSIVSIFSPSSSVVCAWRDATGNALRSVRMDLTRSHTFALGSINTFAQGMQAEGPRLSKSGGSSQRYAVGFAQGNLASDPWAVVLDGNGAPLTVCSRSIPALLP